MGREVEGTVRARTRGIGWRILLLGLLTGNGSALGAEPPPNLVLILADDLGWGDVGFNGRTEWSTPNLDRLAAAGTTFRRFYAASPVCAPSRAALLSGQYTIHCGVRRNEEDLPSDRMTIAEALRSRGFAAAMVGKWHRGKPRVKGGTFTHPIDQGFDPFFGFTDAVHAWEKYPSYLWDGRRREAVSGYADDLFTDRAIEFLGRQEKDRPYFLYVAYTTSHFNIEAPADEVARQRGIFRETDPARPLNATYAAMVAHLDHNVGRLLQAIEARGLAGRTLIVFASDNGATFESGNQGTSNALDSNRPLRGQKRTLWEGGIRVPGVARWPGHIPAGVISTAPVHAIDLLPTFLAAAGGTPDPSWRVDGSDLLPTWAGTVPPAERTLFWEWRAEGANQLAALRGDLKLVVTNGGKAELYDVASDVAERRDVTAEHPEEYRRLQEELNAWLATEVQP